MKKYKNEVIITINIYWPPYFTRFSHIYSNCRSLIIESVG